MTVRAGSRLKAPVAHVFGLTGGIAAGKSTAARMFAEAGIHTLDADEVAHELSQKGGRAHEAIFARFGTVKRNEIRERVFKDPVAKRDLEAILHPLIRLETQDRIQKIVDQSQATTYAIPIIYEAALLVETGYYKHLAGLIVVSADEKIRVQRLLSLRQMEEAMARRIIHSQIDDAQRRAAATWILENSGSLEDLRRQVVQVIPQLQNWKQG